MIQGPEKNAVWLKARQRAKTENNLKMYEKDVMIMKDYEDYDILRVCILC